MPGSTPAWRLAPPTGSTLPRRPAPHGVVAFGTPASRSPAAVAMAIGKPVASDLLASATSPGLPGSSPAVLSQQPQPLQQQQLQMQVQEPAAATTSAGSAEYHQVMQELLQKERRAMRERQAAARAAAVAAAATATAAAAAAAAAPGAKQAAAAAQAAAATQAAAAATAAAAIDRSAPSSFDPVAANRAPARAPGGAAATAGQRGAVQAAQQPLAPAPAASSSWTDAASVGPVAADVKQARAVPPPVSAQVPAAAPARAQLGMVPVAGPTEGLTPPYQQPQAPLPRRPPQQQVLQQVPQQVPQYVPQYIPQQAPQQVPQQQPGQAKAAPPYASPPLQRQPPLAPPPPPPPPLPPLLRPPAPVQAPAAPLRRVKEPAAALGLPDLLPGLKLPTKQKRKSAGAPLTTGPTILATSSRSGAGEAGGGGGGGILVGSTRSAKAEFTEPAPPSRFKRPASAAHVRDAPYSYGYGSGYEGPYDGGAGEEGSLKAGGAGQGLAPMVQRVPLSLNPNMAPPRPAAGVRQQLAASAPPGAAVAAVATAGGRALGDGLGPMAPGAAVGGAASIDGDGVDTEAESRVNADVSTATEPAGETPPAAAAAVAARKKKSARPAALWMTSFVQAGVTAGAGGNGGASAAAAASKQPAADAGALAAAMIRAAVARPARELSAAVSDLPAPIPELQARLEAAVQAEQESELRALRALYASGSLRQLQREGVVLVGLTAAEAGRLYRSTLWKFAVMQQEQGQALGGGGRGGGGGAALPYHKLRPGASVIITRHAASTDPSGGGGGGGGSVDAETGLPADGVEGVVVEAHKDHLKVALEGRTHETFQTMVAAAATVATAAGTGRSGRGGGEGGGAPFLGWRLDQSVRDTTTRRHLEGIRRLGVWTESPAEGRLGEARVRAVLAGSRSASLIAAEPPEWVKEGRWREDARAELASQPGLNDSQRRAVAAALTRTVTLWQGPPGTGKTRTLLALTEVLVRVRRHGGPPSPASSSRSARSSSAASTPSSSPSSSSSRSAAMGPVLAVADTNAAVDNLVEGLATRGVVAVRLGPAAKARESLRHLSLEAQAEATPLGRKAVALRAQALRKQEQWRELQAVRHGTRVDAAASQAGAAQAAEVRSDLERAETALRQAATMVVAAAEVVVATCTAAGDSVLDGRPWRCVVVDEASQATEPSVLVALTRGSAFVVMAGDPRQLPPTVMSEAALQHGLDVTLFERVAGTGGVMPLLLDTQYRMHPAISAFPSAFFYGGKLRDGVAAADKPIPRGFLWPNPAKPLALVSVTGGREETSGGIAELSFAASAGTTTRSSRSGNDAAVLQPRGAAGKAGSGPTAAAGSESGTRSSYRNPAEALLALAVTQQLLAAGAAGCGRGALAECVCGDLGLWWRVELEVEGLFANSLVPFRSPSSPRSGPPTRPEPSSFPVPSISGGDIGDVKSAAILTPYRGQVRLVEALARQRGLDVAWSSSGLEVAVSTVDGYQGREADVVVFSAVRANDRGAVGFLSDPRRMNVAITRPRRGLVVLTDTGTLTRGSADWATYIKWARAQGAVTTDLDVIDVEAALSSRSAAAVAAAAAASSVTASATILTTSGAGAGAGTGTAASKVRVLQVNAAAAAGAGSAVKVRSARSSAAATARARAAAAAAAALEGSELEGEGGEGVRAQEEPPPPASRRRAKKA